MFVPHEKENYARISDEDSQSEYDPKASDELLLDGGFARQSSRWTLKSHLTLAIGALIFLIPYTFITVKVTSAYWQKERLHGASVIDSPLREYIHYEPTMYRFMESSKDYSLVGMPSDKIDARWSTLMRHFFTEVPYEYMKKLGRLDEGLQLPNGNYVANYAFMHQLHCLKRIYTGYFPERYFPNMTEHEKELQLEHNLHCLEMVIEGVMCKADETPLTLRWLDNTPLPTGNRTIAHECVNWDRITEGLERYRVDPFVPGVFVHPKFGAVVPDGRNTVIENRIGYTPGAKGLDYNKFPTHAEHRPGDAH